MRLFTIIAVLLMVAASFFVVDGVLKSLACARTNTLSFEPWTSEFWLLVPGDPTRGLAANGKWFMRVTGGLLAFGLGFLVLRAASR